MKIAMKFAAAVGVLALGFSVVPAARAADTNSEDKKFLEDAGKGNLAEVKMAQLALKNSTNKSVREFATKMVHDHTMLQNSMKPFDAKMGVGQPTEMDRSAQDEYDRLSKKKGESFDKDYITTAADDHRNDLMAFDKEIQDTQNPQLKASVTKARGIIAEHKQMIDGMAAKYNIAVKQ